MTTQISLLSANNGHLSPQKIQIIRNGPKNSHLSFPRESVNAWKLMGATVLSIILNLFGISRYGVTGAACATLLCEVRLIVMLSLQVWKTLI